MNTIIISLFWGLKLLSCSKIWIHTSLYTNIFSASLIIFLSESECPILPKGEYSKSIPRAGNTYIQGEETNFWLSIQCLKGKQNKKFLFSQSTEWLVSYFCLVRLVCCVVMIFPPEPLYLLSCDSCSSKIQFLNDSNLSAPSHPSYCDQVSSPST